MVIECQNLACSRARGQFVRKLVSHLTRSDARGTPAIGAQQPTKARKRGPERKNASTRVSQNLLCVLYSGLLWVFVLGKERCCERNHQTCPGVVQIKIKSEF